MHIDREARTFRRKSLLSNVVFTNINLEFVARDKVGNIIGAALGYSWGGISELK